MRSTLDNLRVRLGTRRQMRRTGRRLRGAGVSAATFDEVVAAAFSTAEIAPLQVPTELTRLAEMVSAERPRRILEIGTGCGGTLFALAWAAPSGARLLSLDLTVYPAERRLLYRTFAKDRHVEAWEADSHLEQTRDRVAAHFGHQPLDILFIDGDHTYESVRRDYELYAPLVREGGIIAFHDIVDGPYEAVADAPRFWKEVRKELEPVVELVESWDQGGLGIGVGRRYTEAHGRASMNSSSSRISR